ncbi:MAG: SMUG2 DNA glycosylase family protein [Bacteroidales bacterium]|jgi:hypothetical protein|nr:SMUG2 DNA glycosylase family protein [Bacteroidales bacterium]
MATFAEKVINFYRDLEFTGRLPYGVSVMNPMRENENVFEAASQFYRKYYSDNNPRRMILGINPGRFGAGATGIPFTDTIRMQEKCGLSLSGIKTYETSSVFIYEMIDKYGGTNKFYGDYFISSVSPLGFTKAGPGGRPLNYNYYDSREMTDAVYSFAVDTIKRQLDFGIITEKAFCLGAGKNFRFLSALNAEYRFFDRIIPLEHPRFIMQYRAKQKEDFIKIYIETLRTYKS